jgi:hypothetical protein
VSSHQLPRIARVGLVELDAEGERLPRARAVERLVEVVAAAADGVTRMAAQRRRRAVAELRRAFAAPGALEPGEDFAGLSGRRRRRREQECDDGKRRCARHPFTVAFAHVFAYMRQARILIAPDQ